MHTKSPKKAGHTVPELYRYLLKKLLYFSANIPQGSTNIPKGSEFSNRHNQVPLGSWMGSRNLLLSSIPSDFDGVTHRSSKKSERYPVLTTELGLSRGSAGKKLDFVIQQ